VGYMLAGMVVLWLAGCFHHRSNLPDPNPEQEFRGRARFPVDVKEIDWVDIAVSRPQNLVSVRHGDQQFVSPLPTGQPQKTWIINHNEKTFVLADPSRLHNLPGDQSKRLRHIWDLEGLESYRSGILHLLGPMEERIPREFRGQRFEKASGSPWEGRETLDLTYSYNRRKPGMISLISGERVDLKVVYLPEAGLIHSYDGKPVWESLSTEPVAPEEFAVPEGYTERWTDKELEATTPTSPLTREPPPGYKAIGGTDVREFGWRGQRVTQIRQKWIQKDRKRARYQCWLALYYFQDENGLDEFFLEKRIGFEQWDQEPIVPDATARISHDRVLMRRGKCLVRMDWFWFEPGDLGQRTPPDNEETAQEILGFAQRLSSSL
jgi:hypothetical protein